jgi:hypothetical protein
MLEIIIQRLAKKVLKAAIESVAFMTVRDQLLPDSGAGEGPLRWRDIRHHILQIF